MVTGDGYLGAPAAAPYDRVIVTVGISGLSPRWLEQLVPGGFVLAPVRHAGHHPVMRVRPGDPVTAAAVCGAGFMAASGPLSARYPWAHPEPWRPATEPATAVTVPARWKPALGDTALCRPVVRDRGLGPAGHVRLVRAQRRRCCATRTASAAP